MLTAAVETYPGRAIENGRLVAWWLVAVAAATVGTLVVGGITRLTLSGLSITEWNPVMGIRPPLTEGEWQAAFERYRQIPEYREIHAGMSLGDFKGIYFWEYLHRLLARTVGLVALAGPPLLWLAGRIDRRMAASLMIVPVLVLCQGILGWYMVASGLENRTSVSQYRLTAHLALALTLYALCVSRASALLSPGAIACQGERRRWLIRGGYGVLVLVGLTILAGGFAAGTRAGLVYNTFPLMDGAVVPPDYLALKPWWLNPFENVAAIQFDHRLLAEVTALGALSLVAYALTVVADPALRRRCWLIGAAVLLQLSLGISTLLYVVPAPLAVAHQAGAVVLLTTVLVTLSKLTRPATGADAKRVW